MHYVLDIEAADSCDIHCVSWVYACCVVFGSIRFRNEAAGSGIFWREVGGKL